MNSLLTGNAVVHDAGQPASAPLTKKIVLTSAALICVAAVTGCVLVGAHTVRLVAFTPVWTTIWACADLLITVILFCQFFASGSIGSLTLAAAFAYSTFIAIPYLFSISGVAVVVGQHSCQAQLQGMFWVAWHLVFALAAAIAFVIDPTSTRRLGDRRRFAIWACAAVTAAAACTIAIAFLAHALAGHMAPIVIAGVPTRLYTMILAPAVGTTSFAAFAVVLLRGRTRSTAGAVLALVLFASTVNAFMNAASGHTFSLPWYLAKVVGAVASLVGAGVLASEAIAMYMQLADLAHHDPLTGLQNRRGLERHLRRTFDRMRNGSVSLAVLLVDIDHFKHYNDSYGHVSGDVAITRVAAILRDSSPRRHDLVARYGGEEFLLALFDVSESEVSRTAESLRRRVESEPLGEHSPGPERLTVSVGIAHAADASEAMFERLVANADRALYDAKALGRNRCVVDSRSAGGRCGFSA